MIPLVLGLTLFIAIHVLPMRPDLRSGLVGRYGEAAYKGVFSVVALVGLALIVVGYHKAQVMPGKNPQLWLPPLWGRHATMALMLPVFPLLIAAYLPGRITAAVRHPMILAVKLWALAHLLVRGDAASVLLFGGLLAWAVADRISLKRREAAGLVKIKSGPVRNDAVAVVGGLILYALFARWGHPLLIGVPLLPG
ncbi:MAG TPA: NnrU family protein [Hyphomicrobiaceae bacterium]|nr:NnrU family protein [Hyphomicrobiaceae bacterium]